MKDLLLHFNCWENNAYTVCTFQWGEAKGARRWQRNRSSTSFSTPQEMCMKSYIKLHLSRIPPSWDVAILLSMTRNTCLLQIHLISSATCFKLIIVLEQNSCLEQKSGNTGYGEYHSLFITQLLRVTSFTSFAIKHIWSLGYLDDLFSLWENLLSWNYT